jgi:hypothetical protein
VSTKPLHPNSQWMKASLDIGETIGHWLDVVAPGRRSWYHSGTRVREQILMVEGISMTAPVAICAGQVLLASVLPDLVQNEKEIA